MRQFLRGCISALRISCLRNDAVVTPTGKIDENCVLDSIKDEIITIKPATEANPLSAVGRSLSITRNADGSSSSSNSSYEDSWNDGLGDLLIKSQADFDYHLRDLPPKTSFDYLTWTTDPDSMTRRLFGWEFEVSYSLSDDLLRTFYNMVVYDAIQGPLPPSPFPNVKSFMNYLFVECRDLRLIHVMLNVLKGNPLFLRKYDQELNRHNINSNNAHKATLQLMGFSSLPSLLKYYKNRPDIVEMCPLIGETIENIKKTFWYLNDVDGNSDRDDFWIEEYVNEQVY